MQSMSGRVKVFLLLLCVAASARMRDNSARISARSDSCSLHVQGGQQRDSAGSSWGGDCMCPENSVIVGEDPACEYVGKRYFPSSIPQGVCKCKSESDTVFGDMAHNILPCIDPDVNNDPAIGTPEASLEDLKQIMSSLRSNNYDDKRLKVDGWANRPFASMAISARFPWHMTIGLAHSESKYTNEGPTGKDSFCFDFDYSNASASDPNGCRVFQKSFSPLKELRNCIIGHLETDTIWPDRRGQAWENVKEAGVEDFESFSNSTYDDWCLNSVYAYTKVGLFSLPVQLCNIMDTIRRAEEMIKFALFKKGGVTTDPAEVSKHVQKKIQQTASWPGMRKGGQQSVSKKTADAISKQCFKVKDDNVEQYFTFLQRIGTCLPLMYDKTEIGDGFGFQDGYIKLGNTENYGQPVNLHLHHVYDVPPVCGRLALAAIPGIQSARYNLAPSFQSVYSADKGTPWLDCGVQDTRFTNCRKAYFCWEKSLNLMCGIDEACCPGKPAQAKAHHDLCKVSHEGRCADMKAD